MQAIERKIPGELSRQRLVRCILTLLLLVFSPLAAGAQAPGSLTDPKLLESEAQEISESVMSPFCPGRTLSSCPSSQARELRTQILSWLKQGYTPSAVYNQLLTIYGEDVRGAPRESGFGFVGWLAPVVFVLLCLGGCSYLLRRMHGGRDLAGSAHGSGAAVDEELRHEVEEELRRRRN